MVLFNSGQLKKKDNQFSSDQNDKESATDKRVKKAAFNDDIDKKYGYEHHKEFSERTGWLINMYATDMFDSDRRLVSASTYQFLQDDGMRFKICVPFQPYFYVATKDGCEREVSGYLSKKYAGKVFRIETLMKEDLDLPNHLTGLQAVYLKLSFLCTDDLLAVRRELMSVVRKNKAQTVDTKTAFARIQAKQATNGFERNTRSETRADQFENIIDVREYDVPYHVRASIDLNLFIGHWYSIFGHGDEPPDIRKREDLIDRPEPVVYAFDIECSKLPLKFPDPQTDPIIMISYMIDGNGFLICNREIISADIENFEYTPKPEYEGKFVIFNEPTEEALLHKWIEHILEVRPHIFVTYNGDMFDWPYIQTRAAIHGIDIEMELGFASANNEFRSNSAIHMDCLRWVKRDSYLPVGSQGLKAVTKAKLRYDPIEVDPEDMCRMAAEDPQTLSNYSVSDSVATYYLYMKYVHPFIFALCTIIPLTADEVLRKGSGTLCEALLMVEAYRANIVYPNKQESILNKMTKDGHVLDSETYVGANVDACESGVFRADIPCRFRMVPEAFQKLRDDVERAMRYSIEVEENIPFDTVTNFDEVCQSIKDSLEQLRDNPNRLENPVIYHLDVAAMYPNIILTNRLQPPAIVDEQTCAGCDFNRPGAKCQRSMTWTWRGEVMSANRGEFQRIQQQLESEKFPPLLPGGPQRAFHQLSRDEKAQAEKKRLVDYCKKAYKKAKVTKIEDRTSTVCMRENSFYVDTVRAFRDRRYEFKGLTKVWNRKLVDAKKAGDAAATKKANGLAVLYDSLQLAHKCILNSFYGYVMRKGSRWFSMEMAGIVCYTGACIITQAQELCEQIGRPLELDTDGIWCCLPASFPENYDVKTTDPKKAKVSISYPGAMLNIMVKDGFTNEQYHNLTDKKRLRYEVSSENSIFFEVDGPYKSMILPASKDEGKKLKKRYAVFNFDGTLAELKGFEVKRRGELQLIKHFQSSVFQAFLKGTSLGESYGSAAQIADYWLDVLFSKASNMPDSELFELVSENRSMSRALDDYGSQKSTSISTAKRLAEFLGDQMVKDAGLSCRFVISKKPEGAPVTERAIPVAIFQTEPTIRTQFLRKWLKFPALQDCDIRHIIDWDYYIERLGNAIQKIITIPAAMQGISNPVPRISHPDWLHKKLMAKNDICKQKFIVDMFSADNVRSSKQATPAASEASPTTNAILTDLEEIGRTRVPLSRKILKARKNKSKEPVLPIHQFTDDQLKGNWHSVVGSVPPYGETKQDQVAWLDFQKKKWHFQRAKRDLLRKGSSSFATPMASSRGPANKRKGASSTMAGFLLQKQRSILDLPWQVVQIVETNDPGCFRLWALIGSDLHSFKLRVQRKFYINKRTPKTSDQGPTWRKVNRILPRAQPVLNLYEYRVAEEFYQSHINDLMADLSNPDIEGIYETQVPLMFRCLVSLGCICTVNRRIARDLYGRGDVDNFDMDHLEFRTLAQFTYLEPGSMKYIYFYHHSCGQKNMYGIFFPHSKHAEVIVLDTVKNNQLPAMDALYNEERRSRISSGCEEHLLPDANYEFNGQAEKDRNVLAKRIQQILSQYKNEHNGPTFIVVQSRYGFQNLAAQLPMLSEFPLVPIHPMIDEDDLYNILDWQRVGFKRMVQHFLNADQILLSCLEQCRYFHIPLGNFPQDPTLFGCDIFFARLLMKHGHVLWCSSSDRPDLGGKQTDYNRLLMEEDAECFTLNQSGCYQSISIELEIASLAVNAILESVHANESDGLGGLNFDTCRLLSIDELMQGGGQSSTLSYYDETALCTAAFRVLKTMVHGWVHDVTRYENVFADFQTMHFYRWIRSPNALLYDPALRRMLQQTMKKVFVQLLAELERLGAKIIHANFNRILVETKKNRLVDAVGYMEYVVKTVQTSEMFRSVSILPSTYWMLLLWLDSANYGGVKALQTDLASVTAEDNFDVDMYWNISKFLPQAADCQRNFDAIIAGFIFSVYKEYAKIFVPGSADELTLTSQEHEKDQAVAFTAFKKKLIRVDLSRELFGIVQKILNCSLFRNQSPENIFPQLPGSHLKLTSPALEFSKSICHIFALDETVEEEVQMLRSDLLRLVGVGEFSDLADWHDPCLTLVLPEVFCKICNRIRDLDLCRDSCLYQTGANAFWKCSSCSTQYDPLDIEKSLLEMLSKKTIVYSLQDLKCEKCSMTRMLNLSKHCECRGEYTTLLNRDHFFQFMKTFHSVAKFYNMVELLDSVSWIMEKNNFTL